MPVSRRPRDRSGERPRLNRSAVLLDRPGDELQVGLGPEAVVLSDPTGRWRTLLDRCTGRLSARQLGDSLELSPDDVSGVLAGLAERRLLDSSYAARAEHAAGTPRTMRPRGRLVGAGELGSALARLLPATGLDVVYVIDPSPPDAARYAASAARSQAEALCARLDSRRFRPVGHWSKPAGVEIAITVVTTPTVETDRIITDDLTRSDQPHLMVRPLPDGVVVGPLVVPGVTPCLRCCDLARRDRDPQWPALLRQLTRIAVDLDPVLQSWAAATAALQVAGFLDGQSVDTLAGCLEVRSTDLRQTRRSWRLHPDCSCHW